MIYRWAKSGVFANAAKIVAVKLALPEKQVGAIGTVILGFIAAIIFGVPVGRLVAIGYKRKAIKQKLITTA